MYYILPLLAFVPWPYCSTDLAFDYPGFMDDCIHFLVMDFAGRHFHYLT